MTTTTTTALTTALTSSISTVPSTPAAGPLFDSAAVVALAEAVDRDGLDAHAATLFALSERASEAGVSPVLVDVMLGAGEPYVARLRAFVRVGQAVVAARLPRVAPQSTARLVAA